MNSKGEIRRSILDLNPLIVCRLCCGYFIDPVTLVECLHSFCKTCIMKHVEKSEACPVCDTLIHKTKPLSSMREDKTLQDIVFKIVPGLHHNEMLRRKRFYESHPSKVPDVLEREIRTKVFFNQEDKFSLSIQYFDPSGTKQREENPNKRYLECPGPLQVCHLKKFIAMKYGLSLDAFIIDIIYKEDLIPNNYTLIDIAYNYNWKKDHPMEFFYRIFKKSKVLLKRKRKTSRVEEKCSSGEATLAEKPSSPKKWKADHSIVPLTTHNRPEKHTPKVVSSSKTVEKKKIVPPGKNIQSNATSSSVTVSPSQKPKEVSKSTTLPSTTTSSSSSSKSSSKSTTPLPKILVSSSKASKEPLSSKPTLSSTITTTQTTSIISKEDKNGGKTLIIRKSPINSSGVSSNKSVKLSPGATSKITVDNTSNSNNAKLPMQSPTVAGGQNHHHRHILPKSDKANNNNISPVNKTQKTPDLKKSESSSTKATNGNGGDSKGISSKAALVTNHKPSPTTVPQQSNANNSQNNLSNIVKSLTAKKQLEGSSSSAKATLEQQSVTEKKKASTTTTTGTHQTSTASSVVTSKSAMESNSEAKKPSMTTSTTTTIVDTKDNSSSKPVNNNNNSSSNSPAEALAQSIIANYAIAAAAQHVNAAQALSNQLSLSRGSYEHLLRPPYVKVSDPSNGLKMLKSAASASQGSSSQIPNTNRLQFKVQATSGSSNNGVGSAVVSGVSCASSSNTPGGALNSLFSGKQTPSDIKSLFGAAASASVKKFGSGNGAVPKALNQSIRQIPNPSLLTNKGNSAVSKKN